MAQIDGQGPDLDTSALKRFATMQAQLALKGHALEKLTSTEDCSISYVVSNWGQSRVFSNWEDVSAFYILIGGRA